MSKKHIVQAYDEELDLIKSKVLEMGQGSESQLNRAMKALAERNEILAKQILNSDNVVNRLQQEVDTLTVQLLAKRQPMALDLRNIVSGLKIAADLERIADYAANIAESIRCIVKAEVYTG